MSRRLWTRVRTRGLDMRRVSILIALLTACAEGNTSAPGRAIVGRWGGVDAELTANTASVQLLARCDSITFLAPLVPDAAGYFVIQALGRSGPDRRPNPPSILRGRVAGTVLDLELSYLHFDTTRTLPFRVALNQPQTRMTVCAASL
jgi:hypothetical protein